MTKTVKHAQRPDNLAYIPQRALYCFKHSCNVTHPFGQSSGCLVDNQTIKRHFIIFSVLLMTLAVVNTAGWHHISTLSERYYDLINVSGKQRMLTQRIAYFSTKDKLDGGDLIQLENALELIKQNHLKFISGSETFNLKKPQPGDPFHELFFGPARLDKGIHHLVKAVHNYVETEGAERPFDVNSTIPNQLLSKTNLAVELYLKVAKNSTQQKINWLILCNFILLMALLICVSLLYKQLAPDAPACESLSADGETDNESGTDQAQQQAQAQASAGASTLETKQATNQTTQQEDIAPLPLAVNYTTDLPHPLEFKRLLWLGVSEHSVAALLKEMKPIVGLSHQFAPKADTAIALLTQGEQIHRPFDLLICKNAELRDQVLKGISRDGLMQEYCILYLSDAMDADDACLQETLLQNPESAVKQIVDCFAPYKHLLHHASPHFANKQVLLADDNEINLMVLQGMVKRSDVCCVVAHDGREALEAAKTQVFDLIFMDLQMPVMNGYEASQQILQTTDNHNTPIIAVTANHNYDDRVHCQQIGLMGCEAKPVHHADIEKILFKYLQSR